MQNLTAAAHRAQRFRLEYPQCPLRLCGEKGRYHRVTLSAILILVLLVGCAGGTGAPGAAVVTVTQDPLRELADAFKDLRAIRGQFEGGTWNDDVDRWMGKKHALMVELGDRLGGGAYSRSQVVDLLGAPDAIAREQDALYDQIRGRAEFEGPSDRGDEFLVYYWRGEHDFLSFTAQGERVLGAGWSYAGE